MVKIVACVNQKGGVGKTTTAVNLASGVGKLGKKVLIVDADPQGNTTSAYGVDKQVLSCSVYDLLIGKSSARAATIETSFDGVSIIPCNMDLAGAEVELIGIENRESQLKLALSAVKAEYDYIFIDCPPSLGLITINALCAADTLLVPIQCEYFALEGLSHLIASVRQIKRLYNPSLELEGVLLTMYDGRLNLTQQVVGEVKRFFKKELYSTVIPRAVRLSEAPSYGMPIQYYDPRNKGAKAYDDLAEEFVKRNGGRT